MAPSDLGSLIEDHALERVPDGERENWLKIAWNTVGLITTLVIMFFGAVVCFVAGVKIALLAGLVSFGIGSTLGWALAGITVETGLSNTLITRQYGLGRRGSALASIIFGFLIVGFLAVENGLLYRGFLFFLDWKDDWSTRILLYGLMTLAWILLTAFGFKLVTRTSSLMIIGFLIVLAWMMVVVLGGAGATPAEGLLFASQLDAVTLAGMGIDSPADKFVFALNLLVGPACALALNTADFGRYGKSTGHVAAAATIAIFMQSMVMMLIGGLLMKAAAPAMITYFSEVAGMPIELAQRQVLRSPDSIAATFIVFGGVVGFTLMLLAQAKAQVLNTYSSSLCIANLSDALLNWRPGRLTFVVLANVIALLMLYGEILHFVEEWIKLLGVLLSALAGTIILDYYFVRHRLKPGGETAAVNWAGVIAILAAVYGAHWLLRPYQPVEVLTSLLLVTLIYPGLRLTLLRPRGQT
ncbi:MAG TPA: cytosine permease [Xanthomonadales bacterium]|nr:cytosine permease [Xanthomonadales bacterium]